MKVLYPFLMLAMVWQSTAQTERYIISQQASLRIVPRYQRWSQQGTMAFSEVSTGILLYYPLARTLGVSVSGSPASASGDITRLDGMSDMQVGVRYHVEGPDLVFTLGVNLPTGKKELTLDEFQTSVLLSSSIFNMQTPNFGQGLNVNPGVIWALPITEDFVAGVGVSYQYKGTLKPLQGIGEYDPGDEIALTGGFDWRVVEAGSLSGDVVFTSYGTDKLGGNEVFASGNRVLSILQFNEAFGSDELRILARFRSRAKSSLAIGGVLVKEEDKIEPDQYQVQASYLFRLNDQVSARLIGEGNFFQTTQAALSGARLAGIGLAPQITISSSLSLPLAMEYQFGRLKDDERLTGIEVSAGLIVRF